MLLVLRFFRALARLRQSTPTFMHGAYTKVPTEAEDIFAYLRSLDGQAYLIVLNFGGEPQRLPLGAWGHDAEILLCTSMARSGWTSLRPLEVGPDEGLLLRRVPI